MISLTVDPQNPDKLILSATVVMYLDRILVESLSDELEKGIREQAVKDIQKSRAVKRAVADAAQKKLLAMLGIEATPAVQENSNGNKDSKTQKA